jgi:hypothetical protein
MTDQTKEQVRLKNKAIFDSVVEIIHILKIRTAVEHTQALDIAEKTYRSGQITRTNLNIYRRAIRYHQSIFGTHDQQEAK